MHRIYTTLRGEIGAYIKYGHRGGDVSAACVGLQGINEVQTKRKTIRKIRRAYVQEEYDLDSLLHDAEDEQLRIAREKEKAERGALSEDVNRQDEKQQVE